MIGEPGSGALRAFLDRFRRHASVPAQASDDIAAELETLFALLDALEREGEALRTAAALRRAERDAAFTARLEELRTAGRREAGDARRRAMARALRSYRSEASAAVETGRAEVERIRAAGPGRIEALAGRVMEAVLRSGG